MKHFPRYWPFVLGIHQSPVNSPHKGQWRGALMGIFLSTPEKTLSKQPRHWWFETPSRSLWRVSVIWVEIGILQTVSTNLAHVGRNDAICAIKFRVQLFVSRLWNISLWSRYFVEILYISWKMQFYSNKNTGDPFRATRILTRTYLQMRLLKTMGSQGDIYYRFRDISNYLEISLEIYLTASDISITIRYISE